MPVPRNLSRVASLLQTGTALAALSALLLACSPGSPSPPTTTAAPATPNAPLNVPLPAAPAPPACGDGSALLAAMSTRDKLAQLLMVGVTGAADARAVVADHHVGGIMVGSWTDLSMLSDGSLPDIAGSAGPLPLAVSVDEEGGRVSRLAGLIGSQPSPRVLAQTTRPTRCTASRSSAAARCARWASPSTSPRSSTSPSAADDTVIGDRSFGSDPATVTEYAGAYARGLRDAGAAAGAQALPRPRLGLGRLARRAASSPRRWPTCSNPTWCRTGRLPPKRRSA